MDCEDVMCKECSKSLGELREGLTALSHRISHIEERLQALEQRPKTMTGSIEGMSESVTITVPEGWFA